MSRNLKYSVFDTGMGWVGVMASTEGLVKSTLPAESEEEAGLLLGDDMTQAVLSPDMFADLAERMRVYFSGREAIFQDKLDLSGFTQFQQAVWKKTGLIPYGETRSYLWVAEQIGKPEAVRAAGQALGKNPLPVIIPCHRVIASDGSLGGFSSGLEMKKKLLQLERIKT